MTGLANYTEPPAPTFLFDLDGTLIDSVYQHVIAWRAALSRLDIDLSVWRIHRRIGMSGGLFVSALLRETGRTLSEGDIAMLQRAHQEEYLAQADSVRPLPGAADLLHRKLEPDPARPRWLLTEPGMGYRYQPHGDERPGDGPAGER
jgi:phosphoglycolate phosphatase-like HAD superfamily hydrolase